MCGVCGIINKLHVTAKEEKLIEKMNEIQKHRGPDDEGIYIKKRIALGHRRLSIFDLSIAGHQPMLYKDKYVISYNGEVYNYQELKKELEKEGYQFFSNTDTEVIMAAYDRWGIECLHRLNGFWAFALYDIESEKLILSRDRFGVKPLYYNVNENRIIFASEIKAILEDSSIKRAANDKVVQDFLVNGLVDCSNETFFSGIYKIPAGCNMIVQPDLSYMIQRYYEVCFSDCVDKKISKKKVRKFRELFTKSVKLRLRADVKIGSCLSGGLDSSSIVCQASELLKKDGAENKQETFSACYRDFSLDESKYINEVVEKTGVKSNLVYPDSVGMCKDLKKMIYHQDEPFGTMSIYASYCVMRRAKENGVVVLLDGQGADEILCGYRKSRIYYIKKLISQRMYMTALRELLCSLSQFKVTESRKNDIFKIRQILFKQMNMREEKLFLNKAFAEQELGFHYNSVDNFMYTDFYKISLPALLRFADKNAMAFSIEDRLPFLDFEFVEFASQLPLSMKIYKGYSKYIMRKALDMPECIRKRKDKIGFATPDLTWIRVNDNYFLNLFKDDAFRAKRFIDNKKIVCNWEKIISGEINVNIFRYICLELWMQIFSVT